MAAPQPDPNAAEPPLGGGVEELFEELDDAGDEIHAHARVCGNEEQKETVILEDTSLVGLLPKSLTDQQLDAPTTVVELTLKMIKDAVDDDRIDGCYEHL